MKILGPFSSAVLIFAALFLIGGYDKKIASVLVNNQMLASVFFTQSTTAPILRAEFDNVPITKKKLNILIVPGHEPDFGGTEYRNIKERDLNAELGLDLAQYLVEDGHYNVVMTRGSDGWNPFLANYFTTNANEIRTFEQSQKAEMAQLVSEGRIITKGDNVPHNDAPDDVAMRLYGINKWANDNKVDIAIHIHFNDSSPRRTGVPGEYNGFTIYTPDHQYSNSQATAEIAKNVFKRLSRMFSTSNLPVEDQGIIEDQDLIAVGTNNTADAASMLIEYGYIYEPQLQVPEVRTTVLKEMAFQTYLGLADFFGETPIVVGQYQSTLLPYNTSTIVKKTKFPNVGALKFQAALTDKGFYPPSEYSKNDCPMTGFFGTCTALALGTFQRNYGIAGEKGIVGPQTRARLQALFQPNLVSTIQ